MLGGGRESVRGEGEGFDGLVFNQWTCGPAVDAEVGVAGRGEGGGVSDSPPPSRIPAFAGHEATAVAPLRGVRTACTAVVRYCTTGVVVVEAVEVAIICAGAWCCGPSFKAGDVGVDDFDGVRDWRSEGS